MNFIPPSIFAEKSAFVPTIQESGRYFESPFGAIHMLVAIMGNFGWGGGILFALVFGWVMGSIRKVSRSGWWLYFYLCGLLPFMFFRDGFSIFNKAALFNGFILMWFITALDRTFRSLLTVRRTRSSMNLL